jgi:peptide-methionine (S)-S-oxide reductase
MENNAGQTESAVLRGGCFWCIEAVFSRTRGVKQAVSGYAGGIKENPNYIEVCSGTTGHAEVVKVDFDPQAISYEQILGIFFSVHDPTSINRQGNDVGPQYRSVIFYLDDRQKASADMVVKDLTVHNYFDRPIVSQILPLEKIYPAEDYHQQYYYKNPGEGYCQLVVAPKLAKFRERFKEFYL